MSARIVTRLLVGCKQRLLTQQQQAFVRTSRSANALTNNLPDHVTLPNGTVLKRPSEPEPHECCGRGCEYCVWTNYWQDLRDFKAAVAHAEGGISKDQLDPFEQFEKKMLSKQE